MIYDNQTSSSMNYYEELGVSQQATEQEIRKAHRRLVKLMHPDAQPDQSLKLLAETQMRRLNSIVSTLLDREQRQEYDEQLRASSMDATHRPAYGLAILGGMPWWMASAVAAIILSLGAVWLWADHLGNTFGRKSNRSVLYIAPENRPALPAPASVSDPTAGDVSAASSDTSDKASTAAPEESHAGGGIVSTVISDPPSPVQAPPVQAPPVQAPPIQKTALQKSAEAPKPTPKPPAMAAVTHPPLVPQKAPVTVPPAPAAVHASVRPEIPKPAATKVSPPKVNTPAVALNLPKPKTESKPAEAKTVEPKHLLAKNDSPKTVQQAPSKASDPPAPKPKKQFELPAGSLIASAAPVHNGASQLPPPPGLASPGSFGSASLPASPLPVAVPPKAQDVSTSASPGLSNRDPLEGEWVYAPKEPERRRAGFYPPEYIDLKLFGSGDPGNLKGQYSARYVVTDRPVSPEISFQLASVSKGSRKFVWQSSSGAKGTLSIDPIDDRTIRVDWHTTSSIRGPALTSGQATLVRRQ
jgi:curved DNA-binding protein CbpA